MDSLQIRLKIIVNTIATIVSTKVAHVALIINSYIK